MWYHASSGVGFDIAHATSTDGRSWVKAGLVLQASGPLEYNAVAYAEVLRVEAEYWIWYSGHDGTSYRIFLAASQDGVSWTRKGLGLELGSPGSTDDADVYDPSIIYIDGAYYMWYSGRSRSEYRPRVHLAMSPDGTSWTRHGVVLEQGPPGSFDDVYAAAATVRFVSGTYQMVYTGLDSMGVGRLGLADSRDGRAWEKRGIGLDIGPPDETPTLDFPVLHLERNGSWSVYYAARGIQNQIFLATRAPVGTGLARITTGTDLSSDAGVPGTISIDAVPRDTFGLNWLKLPAGTYDVSFSDVPGFGTPADLSVTIVAGGVGEAKGIYKALGWMRVITDPPVPATIFVDGVPRNDWGVWVALPPGTYEVSFGEVDGFRPPTKQTATVRPEEVTTVVGAYRRIPGAKGPDPSTYGLLRVTTQLDDRPSGAPSTILVDDIPRDVWGLAWMKISPGVHSVEFTDVPGLGTAPPQRVEVLAGGTAEVAGVFRAYGSLRILTEPPVPGTIFVDGIPRNDWGMWQSMPPGRYEVSFGPVEGFVAPNPVVVGVRAGELTTVQGDYSIGGAFEIIAPDWEKTSNVRVDTSNGQTLEPTDPSWSWVNSTTAVWDGGDTTPAGAFIPYWEPGLWAVLPHALGLGTCTLPSTQTHQWFRTSFDLNDLPNVTKVELIGRFPHRNVEAGIIPMNDNLYAFVNPTAFSLEEIDAYGGVSAERGGFPPSLPPPPPVFLDPSNVVETGGWYIRPLDLPLSTLRAGTNAVFVLLEEFCYWGGLGQLAIRVTSASDRLQQQWVRYRENPVLMPGPPGSWDSQSVILGSVVEANGTLHMFYGGTTDDSRTDIGHATSTDGVNWTKDPANPVLTRASGAWDAWAVYGPSVLHDGLDFKMWYTAVAGDGFPGSIGYATSTDGTVWTRYPDNPVLQADSGWDGYTITTGAVVRDAGGYRMWYSGTADGLAWSAGLAFSREGVSWTKYSGNPIITPPFSGSWDRYRVHPTSVLPRDTGFIMWYVGAEPDLTQRVGSAVSRDGIAWMTGTSPVLDLGPPGSWDSVSLSRPTVVAIGDEWWMWYTANDGARWHIGFARAPLAVPGEPTLSRQGLVLGWGAPGEFDSDELGASSVLFDDGRYKMWYFGRSSGIARIGFATSPDGRAWTKHGPVLAASLPAEAGNVLLYPEVLKIGEEFRMWYSAWDGLYLRILEARSPDGVNWTKLGVVLDIGPPGSPEDFYVFDATVVVRNGRYSMWYSATSFADPRRTLFLATSEDGSNWTKRGQVLPLGPTGALDEDGAFGATVRFLNGRYEMVYSGERDASRLMFAESDDGFQWRKMGLALDILLPNEGGLAQPGFLVEADGTWLVYYMARPSAAVFPGFQIFLATKSR